MKNVSSEIRAAVEKVIEKRRGRDQAGLFTGAYWAALRELEKKDANIAQKLQAWMRENLSY
jgi:Arc/MetJ-type ribon-helix-helix transcriptional regulator